MSTQTSDKSTQLVSDEPDTTTTVSQASAIAELTEAYAGLSSNVRVLHEDVDQGRRRVRTLDLDNRTAAKAREGAPNLLDELATDRGFAWSDIARLTRVSVSAVRKWRKGDDPSPERLRDIARLAAFVELLDEVGPVGHPAAWLGMRLSEAHTVTASDLYLAGNADDLLEHAQGQLDLDELLKRWDPSWRETTRSDWQIIDAPDGGRSIVRRT